MKLFLFVDPKATELQTEVAKRLDQKFLFMVDSVHGNDRRWMEKNFSELPHRCFYYEEFDNPEFSGLSGACEVADLTEFVAPVLIVCFHHGEDISDGIWELLAEYFMDLIKGKPVPEDDELVLGLEELLTRCYKNLQAPILNSLEMGETSLEMGTAYGLSYKVFSVQDVCIAEVTKPYTDLPYTIVLREFSKHGFRFLFSGLFIVQSWGICNADLVFLQNLWDHLGMVETHGECDLVNLVREHTELCRPGEGRVPLSEPEVYRKKLEDVLCVLKRKSRGEYVEEVEGVNYVDEGEIMGAEKKSRTNEEGMLCWVKPEE
jgi:hypothetical protein